MNTITITTGNKGGTGKTTLSVLLADYLCRKGLGESLVACDAEASDLQRSFGSIMAGSGLAPQDRIMPFDFGTDEGFERFVDAVAGSDGKSFIVDTGANLQRHLTGQTDFLAASLGDMNARVSMVFMVSPAVESAEALQEFMTCHNSDFRTHLVLMGPGDVPREDYALFRNPDYAGTVMALESLDVPMHFLGTLPQRFFSMIMLGDRLPPSRLLEKLGSVAARRRFRMWLETEIDPALGQILEV